MFFVSGCFKKIILHRCKMIKHRETEIPVRSRSGRVGTGDQEGTVQIPLDLMTIDHLPSGRQRHTDVFAGIVMILARAELPRVNLHNLTD